MSLAHAQGLRDALLKLRDTYAPPTAEEVKLFSASSSTDEALTPEPEPVRLKVGMPVPMPDFSPKHKPVPVAATQELIKQRSPPPKYTAEEVETRWG
ncbi:MAG: hypothetical protein WBP46_18050 [Thiolinea sp.]